MKQTAVEWYIKKIKEARQMCDDASMEMDIWHTLDVLIEKGEQAKEMEKEQKNKMYNEIEVLQLLLKFHQTESFDSLYDWFQQNKKCYHPLTDIHFECTICGYNNY